MQGKPHAIVTCSPWSRTVSMESDCVNGVGLCTLVDATGDHQMRRDKASGDMIHKSTIEIDDRQM